jgi:hypothetical protein
MTLSFQTKKPQPVQYDAVDHTFSFEIVENDSPADDNEYTDLIVRANGIQLPDLTFSNLNIDVSGTITANSGANAFSDVRVGDIVNGNEIDGAGATVTAINGDSSEITVDPVPTGNNTSGSITVTPQSLNSTFAILRLKFSNVNNTDIQLESSLYTFDGSKNVEKRNDAGTDDLIVGDANTTSRTSRTVNAQKYLDNLGV